MSSASAAVMWEPVLTAAQLDDSARHRRFVAAYDGAAAADDAWWWLAHPGLPGPSGARSPLTVLADARAPLYQRAVDEDAPGRYARIEREQLAQWERALAALTAAGGPSIRSDGSRRPRRRTVVLAGSAAALLIVGAVIGVAVTRPVARALPAATASAAPTVAPGPTVTPTSEIAAARLPVSLTETLTLIGEAQSAVDLRSGGPDTLAMLSQRFFDSTPRATTGRNPDPLAGTDVYRDGDLAVGVHQSTDPDPVYTSDGIAKGRLVIGVMLGSATSWQCLVTIVPVTGHSDEGTAPGTQTVRVSGDPSAGGLQYAPVVIPAGFAVTALRFSTSEPHTEYVWQALHQTP